MPTFEPVIILSADLAEQLRERVIERRKAMGLTQAAVADFLSISKGRYNHYERGIRRFPLSLIPSLAAALDCGEADLIGSEQGKPKKRGPASKLEKLAERLAKLPPSKQKVVVEMLESWLDKAS